MAQYLGEKDDILISGDDHSSTVTVAQALPDSVKVLGLYFSMHNCPPCREFTPILAELYNETNESEKQFEVVFFSCDQTEGEYKEYFGEMPWLALPHSDKRVRATAKIFKTKGVPRLVIVNARTGDVMHESAVETLTEQGPVILEEWLEATN